MAWGPKGSSILLHRRFFHFLQIPNRGCACQAAPLWRRGLQGVRGGGRQGRGETPRNPVFSPRGRANCRKAVCAQTHAPPLSKKKGGGRAPAPCSGAPAPRAGSKHGTEKKNALDTPPFGAQQQAQWGVACTAHQQQAQPQEKKTAVSGCFSPVLTPRTPYGAPPKAFLETS